jgi:hypothetical protein
LKKGIVISILLFAVLSHYGCRQPVSSSKTESDSVIPDVVNSGSDLKFKFNQDTLYYGNEKYDGFDLYIRIAQDVNSAIPKDQVHKPIFQQYKWKQKVPQDMTVYSLGV